MRNLSPDVHKEPQTHLQEHLNQDSFLIYKGETDHFYRVQTQTNKYFSIYKNRSVPEPFPYPHSWPLHTPFRWLRLSFLGLLTAGLGTLIFAPLAFISALRVNRDGLCNQDVAKIKIILGSSTVLWLFSILLTALFILHL